MQLNKNILPIVLLLLGTTIIALAGLNWHMIIPAWIAPVFLLIYSRKASWLQMLLFFVMVSFAGAISMTSNNLLHIPMVNFFNGLSFGLLTSLPYIIDKLLYKKSRFYYTLIFPASIALLEYLASFGIGTWGSMAHTQYEFKIFTQLSAVVGIYGIWFMMAWFASLCTWIIENKGKYQIVNKGVLIYGNVLLLVLIYGFIRINKAPQNNETVKVAAVISDVDIQQMANSEANNFSEVFTDSMGIKMLITRTLKAAKQGAKIIAWNEGALILNQIQKTAVISEIQSISKKHEAYVLLTFIEKCEEANKKPFNNVSVFISPTGNVAWEYKKSFLQPTAEAPLINAGNFELPVVETPYGKISNAICADFDMNHYMAQAGKQAVDIMLVPAYDWAEITPLHSQMASIEAIQFGFSVVRSNGMGLSAVYNCKGKEIASLNTLNSNEKILLTELPIHSVKTTYLQIGDMLIYLCVAFMVFMVAKKFLKSKGFNTNVL